MFSHRQKKKSFLHYYFAPKPVLSQPTPIPFPFSEVFSAGVHPCGHIYNILKCVGVYLVSLFSFIPFFLLSFYLLHKWYCILVLL